MDVLLLVKLVKQFQYLVFHGEQGKMTAAVAFPDSSIHFYNLETQKWTTNVLQNIQNDWHPVSVLEG